MGYQGPWSCHGWVTIVNNVVLTAMQQGEVFASTERPAQPCGAPADRAWSPGGSSRIRGVGQPFRRGRRL